MLIDTHAAVRDLTAEGEFTEPQAEKIVAAISRADDKVATKEDVQAIQRDIQKLRQTTQKDIQKLRQTTQKDNQKLRQTTQKDIQNLKKATQKDVQLLRQEIKTTRWQVIVGTASLVTAVLAIFEFLV